MLSLLARVGYGVSDQSETAIQKTDGSGSMLPYLVSQRRSVIKLS